MDFKRLLKAIGITLTLIIGIIIGGSAFAYIATKLGSWSILLALGLMGSLLVAYIYVTMD